jgi:hypothetical protein
MNYKTVFLLLTFQIISIYTFCQDAVPEIIDTPFVTIDTLSIILDPILLPPADSLQDIKDEKRSSKAKKAFQFFSYLKYADKETGEFTGIEKYKKYKGKKIRSIQVEILKPYGAIEDDYSQTVNKAQNFGNKIHFNSKAWFVKNDILFKEGDKVNPLLFADSEKLLWDRKKFKDIRIVLFEDDKNSDTVDVLVFLQDKLSWVVGLGYNNRLIAGISTYNFLGQPNTLSLFAGINFNKYNLWAVGGEYKYENIKASQINFKTDFVVEKLNQHASISLYRNFFSITTQWAFNLRYNYDVSTLSLSGRRLDTINYINTKSHFYALWWAYAMPLTKLFNIKDDNLKFLFATKLNAIQYKRRPFLTSKTYDKIFVDQQNYIFGIGVARWDYYLARNAFYIDAAEFFPRGYSVSFWTGLQLDEVYEKRVVLDVTVNYGIHFKKFGYLYPQFNFKGYVRHKKGEEMVTTISLDYVSNRVALSKIVYFRQILKLSTNVGVAVPEERYFTINDEIRGFFSPTLKGSKSIALKAESDLSFDKSILQTKAMTYIFADMAWISENKQPVFKNSVYQYGVGLGLRLRNVNVGVPHVDVQLSFYPRGKDFGQTLLGVAVYGSNPNAIQQKNMFVE